MNHKTTITATKISVYAMFASIILTIIFTNIKELQEFTIIPFITTLISLIIVTIFVTKTENSMDSEVKRSYSKNLSEYSYLIFSNKFIIVGSGALIFIISALLLKSIMLNTLAIIAIFVAIIFIIIGIFLRKKSLL